MAATNRMPTSPAQARFLRFIVIFSILWLVSFIYFVSLAHVVGPIQDSWDIVYFIQALQQGTATYSLLFEQFYGLHRVALARILMAIEYFVFNGSNIFPKFFAYFKALLNSLMDW